MKRINLEGLCSTHTIIKELGLRPSVERRVINDVYIYDISYARKLCKKSESDLLEIPSFNEDLIGEIKKVLSNHGLHLGMTELDLDNYMDKDFLEAHEVEKPAEDKTLRISSSNDEDSFNKSMYFTVSFMGACLGGMAMWTLFAIIDFLVCLF